MVREQDVIAGSGTVLFKPPCLRFMLPGVYRATDSAYAFLTWVTVGAARFGSESSIICNIAGGQTADDDFFPAEGDGSPLIIQHSATCGGEGGEISTVHHPLMIAEGEKGRGDGGAGAEEGENVGLGSHRTRIIFRPATV